MDKDIIRRRIEEIKTYTKVPDILIKYGVEIKKGRCRGFCHNGDDFNMSIREDRCKCFVCGKAFDIIGIVMHFENCGFMDAYKILGGENKPTLTAHRKAAAIVSEREKLKILKEKNNNKYWKCFQEWLILDCHSKDYAPRNENEKWHDLFCESLQKLEYHKYALECAESERL